MTFTYIRNIYPRTPACSLTELSALTSYVSMQALAHWCLVSRPNASQQRMDDITATGIWMFSVVTNVRLIT